MTGVAGDGGDPLRKGYQCYLCGDNTLDELRPDVWHCRACKRNNLPTQVWMVKYGEGGQAGGEVIDFSVQRRGLGSLAYHVYRDKRKAREVFDRFVSEQWHLPRSLWARVRALLDDFARDQTIHLDGKRALQFTEDTIDIVEQSQRGDVKQWPVIGRPFDVHRRVDVEGTMQIGVTDSVGDFYGTLPEILKRLRAQSQLLDPKVAEQVLAHMIHHSPNHTRGYHAFGVYKEGDDALVIPTHFMPREGPQSEIHEKLQPHLGVVAKPEQWQAYQDFIQFLTPQERVPALALAALAPFAMILRQSRVIVPGILHLSRAHGVGKTSLALAMTERLWSVGGISSDGIGGTGFRFFAYMDAAALPRCVDEAERLDWAKYGGFMKESFESFHGSSRGTKDQGMNLYRGRASLIFTGNHFPQVSEALLARLVVVPFNEERQNMPGASRHAFNQTYNKLDTIGPALAQAGLRLANESCRRLVDHVEVELARALEAKYTGWVDARRSAMWAALYWGLEVWHEASGGIVAKPTLDEFVRDVVAPLEEATRRSVRDPLRTLRDWILQYVSRYSRPERQYDERGTHTTQMRTQGDEVIIRDDVWVNPSMEGHLVTKALLDLYNKDFKDQREVLIGDLPELARLVARVYRIPLEELAGPDADGRRYRFNGLQRRAVFVPAVDPAPTAQVTLDPAASTPPAA